ncbi:MAG: hypothetical protein H8M99_04745 [Gloeobacteraceae cyanobacterium ES-bin-144]|nr:hypothetical protein [Verrucomicrobiales bacterium]
MLNNKTIGTLAAVSALVAGSALAGTPAPTTMAPAAPASAVQYSLHTGYTSEYLWRGQDLGNALIEVGADVATEWNGIGFSAGAWYGSFNAPVYGINGFMGNQDSDELDLYAEVSKDWGFVTTSVGYIAYLYPQGSVNNNDFALSSKNLASLNGSETLQEVTFGLSHDYGFAAVSLNYYWAIEGVNYGYSELDLSRTIELCSSFDLNLSTNVGYLVDEGQCSAWTSKLALDYKFAERAKFSPFVAYSVALSDDQDTAYLGSTNQLVGGAMLSVSF